jgi:hypothetical protein
MNKPIEILVLASKLLGMELNVWFVGEGAERLKLKQRLKMTYGLSEISLSKGKSFDLIIVDFYSYRPEVDVVVLEQAHKQYPDAKIILFASGEEQRRQELFTMAAQFGAQIEFQIGEMAEKIRRFFFPEDFKADMAA